MRPLTFLLLLVFPLSAMSVELSEVALFNRCFSHMTRKAPKLNNSYLKQVVSGQKTAEQACIEVLRTSRLSNGVLKNKNSRIARDIMNTFYAVHSQWFMDNDPNDTVSRINEGIVDPSPGSLYVSKALFDPKFAYKDIFDGAKAYEAVRTGGRTNIFNRAKSFYVVGFEENNNRNRPNAIPWGSVVFPQTGDLIGFKDEPAITVPGFENDTNYPIRFNGSLGGGILGNRDYLMRTISSGNVKSDGAIEMPRRFGRAIFHDFVCQDLPVVDPNLDTTAYVDPKSETPFRTNQGCVACHVSMDQVSGLVRHYETVIVGRKNSNNRAFGRVRLPAGYTREGRKDSLGRNRVKAYQVRTKINGKFVNGILKSNFTWPSNGDHNYYKKTPYGKFVYRTTDGQLISKQVNNFNALGNIFKGLDDTYKCAATRYFEHFTGIKYPITQVSKGLANNDVHAALIEQLTQTLKSTQDPMKVIEAIFASEIYKDANYGVGY